MVYFAGHVEMTSGLVLETAGIAKSVEFQQ